MRLPITMTLLLFISLSILSCTDSPTVEKDPVQPGTIQQQSKPPSSFQDTLFVKQRSAIFYEPDSLQLTKIQALTSKTVFESSIHEYEYQFRNAKNLLGLNWKNVAVLEAKKVRYIHFIVAEGKAQTIDLDKYNDAFGMFVFDPSKPPRPIEMTNAQSLIPDYFERN